MVHAVDMEGYYRIPADTRDLNYNKFVESGEAVVTEAGDYHSHNTKQLSEFELKEMLMKLTEIQADLKEFGVIK
jgi:UDP-glucose 4-epimerase